MDTDLQLVDLSYTPTVYKIYQPSRSSWTIKSVMVVMGISIVVGFFFFYKSSSSSDPSSPNILVHFPDDCLDTEIRLLLRIPKQDPIQRQTLQTLPKTLMLKDKRLTDMTGLEAVTNIEELDVSMNQIHQIPYTEIPTWWGYATLKQSIFRSMTHLKYLNLSSNQIMDISMLGDCISLTHLDLHNNNILHIESLSKLPHIRILHLENNQIQSLKYLRKVTSLYYINISYNQINCHHPRQKRYIKLIKKHNKELQVFRHQPQKT